MGCWGKAPKPYLISATLFTHYVRNFKAANRDTRALQHTH